MNVDKSGPRIRHMFGEIAPRYDLLNHLLSLGIDRWWRRRAVQLVPARDGTPVLDVCTGTGDLALAYWRSTGGRVPIVGVDFCRPMLAISTEKASRAGAGSAVAWIEADARQLPFPDDLFQIVCVAFGLRNVSDTEAGLRELVRVCRRGGNVAILEFTLPQKQPWRTLYGWYLRHVLPRVGQTLAKNRQGAYNYLAASVGEFFQPEALAELMRRSGLSRVCYHVFTLGIAALYVGVK